MWRCRFNRFLCVQIVAVGGSDTVSRLASLHQCMLRRGIGSTGAEEVHWSTQTSFLEHITSNAPMVDSEASVQPVLKANHSHPNMLSGTKYVHCTGAYLFDHRFNRCYRVCWLDFCLHPEKIDRQGVGPSAKHRMHRCMGHRLNRCYYFSWFSAELTWSLNVTLIVSSSKCFVDFFWLSWAVFERVCKISKANSILVKLLTHEPLLIVRSRTKKYKP